MKYRLGGTTRFTEVRENQMKYHMVLNKSEQGKAFQEMAQRCIGSGGEHMYLWSHAQRPRQPMPRGKIWRDFPSNIWGEDWVVGLHFGGRVKMGKQKFYFSSILAFSFLSLFSFHVYSSTLIIVPGIWWALEMCCVDK